MAKRPKIGDIIEIGTAKGRAYALYTHKHDNYGALLRVFSALHEERPKSFDQIVHGDLAFSTFFPLGVVIHRQIFAIVNNQPLPLPLQPFPLFRAGVGDPVTNKVAVWWLWDGQKEWRVGKLTAEQRKLDFREAWNDTLLIERIEQGYRTELHPWH